jgi:eukaryotic-like serine/threonine-protein kinase
MDDSASTFSPGTVLAGKYRVERVIGQGGMGVVVEARHITLDERVALKFLLPELARHPEAPERFLREAKAAVKIKSPHVARVSDVGTLENGSPYMVMEYLEGTDAYHLIDGGRVLSVPDAVDLVVQACDAIASAHAQGIVHRDLKPANLFVARHSDGTPFVRVLDFGISKIIDQATADGLTRTNATLGSAFYMSPEQIRQSKSVDRRTDIYALGVTLFELLSGKHPFQAETFPALCVEIVTGTPASVRSYRPDLPPALAAVIEKAIARELTDRYQTVAELVVALAPWVPPRSQPILERIARSGGLMPAQSGIVAGPASAAALQPGPQSSSTSAPSSNATQGAIPASTHLDAATTFAGRSSSSSGPWLIAGGVLAVAAVIGAVMLLRRGGDAGEPSQLSPGAAVAEKPAPATPTVSALPIETTTATAPPVAAPALPPSANPTEPPAPSPAATTTAAKVKPPKAQDIKRPSKTATTPRPAAAPATPTRGADEYR